MYKLILLLLFTPGFFSCQTEEKTLPPPNILWISAEDISPAWGCYGDKYATTPNIDQLAENGFVYTQAFSNAPICAPARSTLITGMYATSLGTQHLRSEIPVPASLKTLPELMRQAGYFTTNNAKTDYNFSAEGRWDENGGEAHWRNTPDDRPFFSVFNFGITHEGHANTDRPEDIETLKTLHDPAKAELPPYFPDTEEFRSIWAHQYDLITVFDQEVGKLVQQLKEDGEFENTIIFVFGDHGYGLPRYKRWLYNSGLQVPLVLHVPEKYKALASNLQEQQTDQMVGFVDFAPTVVGLAGSEIPEMMEGKNFLGENSIRKDHIYGYRSRADDVYDMARSVYDGRYLYIRHYMPQNPYIQNAVIFNKGKRGYDELFRVKAEGGLPPEAQDMFNPKPVEELYDLQNDPYELDNLIGKEGLQQRAQEMNALLHAWMVEHHDTGLLNEGEMMVRAEGKGSVYEMARDTTNFPVKTVLAAADQVGKIDSPDELSDELSSVHSGVRYWGLIALEAYKGGIGAQRETLTGLLDDPSHSVAIKAAELLVNHFDDAEALQTLQEKLMLDNEPVVLQAAISVRQIGEKAAPLLPAIQNEIMPKYSGDVWGRYKSWSYPMFIGMALDQTMVNCGVDVVINN